MNLARPMPCLSRSTLPPSATRYPSHPDIGRSAVKARYDQGRFRGTALRRLRPPPALRTRAAAVAAQAIGEPPTSPPSWSGASLAAPAHDLVGARSAAEDGRPAACQPVVSGPARQECWDPAEHREAVVPIASVEHDALDERRPAADRAGAELPAAAAGSEPRGGVAHPPGHSPPSREQAGCPSHRAPPHQPAAGPPPPSGG